MSSNITRLKFKKNELQFCKLMNFSWRFSLRNLERRFGTPGMAEAEGCFSPLLTGFRNYSLFFCYFGSTLLLNISLHLEELHLMFLAPLIICLSHYNTFPQHKRASTMRAHAHMSACPLHCIVPVHVNHMF